MFPTLSEVRELFETLCKVELDPKKILLGSDRGVPKYEDENFGVAQEATMVKAREVRDAGLALCRAYFDRVSRRCGPLVDDPGDPDLEEVADEDPRELFRKVPPDSPLAPGRPLAADFAVALADLGIMLQDLQEIAGGPDAKLDLRSTLDPEGRPQIDVGINGVWFELAAVKNAIKDKHDEQAVKARNKGTETQQG